MWRWYGIALLLLLAACRPLEGAPLPTLVPQSIEIFTLNPWETASGTLQNPTDRDEWQFFGRANETIHLRAVAHENPVTMVLRLRDRVLKEGDTIETTLPEDEVYRITVRLQTGNSGSYDIGLSYPGQENPNAAPTLPQVVGVPTPTPAYANLGEFIAQLDGAGDFGGLLTADSPAHVYTFMGSAGEVVTLMMNRVAGTLDPMLMLYDPAGRPIAQDDNSGGNNNARLLNIHLPQTGLYSLQVQGGGLFGDYTLRYIGGELAISPETQPTPLPTSVAPFVMPTVGPSIRDQRLVDHVPVIGNLPREGDFQRFSFLADAGDILTVHVSPYQTSPIRPQFEVYDPEGVLLTSVTSTASGADGVAFKAGIPITTNGAYIILVTGEDNGSGAFVISVGKGTSAYDTLQGEVLSNQQVTSSIRERGERQLWRVTLNPGDVITAAASPTDSNFDPLLELITADGIVLYRDDNSAANNAAVIDIATITEPATYLLRVQDADGTHEGGYVLLWRYVNAALTPTPIPDRITILAVSDDVTNGAYQFYVFQGQAGETIRIEVVAVSGEGFDPVVALLDPTGMVIAEADDSAGSPNPILTTTLPVDGTYSVRVNGYLSGGYFNLSVAALL